MLKLIKHIILFLLPVLILGVIAEYMLRKIPNEYKDKKTYLENNAGQVRVLCLGNSHGFYNINPEYLSFPAFNAANSSQTYDLDWMIFYKYRYQLQQLSYVLIPISYASLYERLETGIESWRVKNYALYFNLDHVWPIRYYSELLNSSTKINCQKLIDYYSHGKYQHNTSTLGFATDYFAGINTDLEHAAEIAMARNRQISHHILEENIQYLNKIIAIAREMNVTIVFFTSPVYQGYFKRMNKEQLKETQDIVQGMTKKYSGVLYSDHLNDTHFSENDFYDADHLNGKGSEKFTKMIDSLIISVESLKK